ncbi:MAG: ATP-binding protein [Defluviitaleaceae bacterium]|nr:ATP-binding protein [Defluviitaleaceae bacterium]
MNMSIKTKFIVVLAVIITIATSAVVAVRAIQLRDQQRALITERLQGNANLAVGIFETVRGYTFRIMDIVATMPYVKELLEGDKDVAETLERRLYSLFYSINPAESEVYAYANIFVFDADLQLVSVANPNGDVIRITDPQFMDNIMAAYNGKTYVSAASRDPESGRLHFLFTQPVMVDGVFTGLVAVLSNTEDLGVFLRDPTHDYDSFINIADAQGTIFFSNRSAYIGRHINDLGVFEAFGRIPINEMFNHTSAITGIDKIAYILVEPKLDWTIICFFDAAAVDDTTQVIIVSLLPTLSGIILASILMLVIVARSLQPLKPLAAAAGEVARGNLGISFEIRRNDEIAQVSKSFLEIVQALGILRDSFIKAEESMTSGDIHYRLEDARLSGVYNEMLISTNNMIRHMRVLHAEAENASATQSDYLDKMNIINEVSIMLFLSDIDGFEHNIWASMEMLGKAANAERMYIWKNYMKDGQLYATKLFEWTEGAEHTQENALAVEACYAENMPAWEEIFLKGNTVNEFVRYLPINEREALEPRGALSVVAAPIYLNDLFWGFAGFDNCREERLFTENEENLLRSAGMLFINAINRNEMAKDVQSALEKAEEATRSKSNFLATMSHEIRTPMNAILGIAQIQMQNTDLPREYASELEKIYSSGNNLLGIINDILDMSKIETGKMEINYVEYDVPSLINDAVQLNIVRIGSKRIEFVLDIDENLPLRLVGDELRLKQILNNLLSNAIKYTESGHVKLTVTHSEENDGVALHLLVEDTGQGMTLEDRDRLFSEYIRFNAEANRKTEGTGLGLSITKKLVELMDGTIWAESEYGKGSVFMVMVKQRVTETGCEPIGSELAEQLCSFRFRGHKQFADLQITREPMPYGKVLIVDDVETNLYVAKGLMAPYKLQIETVLSGFAAIGKITEGQRYDIVFMDHMMPQMDGIETTHRIRAMGYKDTIVALTANALAGNDEMFRSKGFDGFISKPIDIRELNNVLNKFIRDKQPPNVLTAARAQAETADIAAIGADTVGTDTKASDVELLTIFVKDAKKALPTIRTAMADDLRLYVVNVHAMKSALANIGEREASTMADTLETAGKKHDTATIEAETEPFLEKLESIIARIETELPDKDDTSVLSDSDPEILRAKLKLIAEACDDYDDMAVETVLTELRRLNWTKETMDLLDTIAEYVFHSDFEKAAERIRTHLITLTDTV